MVRFHGSNEGSNPSGDANQINILDAFLVSVVLACGAKANDWRAAPPIMRLQLRSAGEVALMSTLIVADVAYAGTETSPAIPACSLS